MQIHAGGMMQCCAVGPDTDLGDFIIDYCNKVEREPDCDPFNSEGLQAVRKGILTGNLRPMCRNCFFTENKLITTEEMNKKVKELLKQKNPDKNVEEEDLTKLHGYTWMAVSFTNRCNLSCIYCVQSMQKETNPYLKMEFPYQYAQQTLDLFALQGIEKLSTCVEGEATLYKYWYELFSEFHAKYPNIHLWMTTNLNRHYTDKELELLASYTRLDVSIDSLDEDIFSKMRVNGRLKLLLENLKLISRKVEQLGVVGPTITLHPVVTDKTWRGLEELADYAFSHNYGIFMGNYEERANTRAYQEKLIVPVRKLADEEQKEAYKMLCRIRDKGEKLGRTIVIQGEVINDLKTIVEKNYNYFAPYDNNPIYREFIYKYPKGTQGMYLDIVYDCDNISHEGIILKKGEKLYLEGLEDVESIIVREVQVFKDNIHVPHYNRQVLLRYRKNIIIKENKFIYEVNYNNEWIEKILLEICEVNLKRAYLC